MIPGLYARDPLSHFQHHSRSLVAENGREESLRVRTRQGELVSMANAGRPNLHQRLARPRAFEIDAFDLEGFARLVGHCGARFHGKPPSSAMPARQASDFTPSAHHHRQHRARH